MMTLENRSGRCRVFVLAHEMYCRALGTCECRRKLARSLTLPAGHTVSGLSEAVLFVPELAVAVRNGELAIVPASAPAPDNTPRQKRKGSR